MIPDGETGAYLAADSNFVLLDQLSDVFERHRSLIERHRMMLSQRVDHVGRGNRLGNTVLPSPGFYQVAKQDGNDVVGRDEGSIFIHHAKAVSIAICGDADASTSLFHLLAHLVQQMPFRLWGMATKEHVAGVMARCYMNTGIMQELVRVSSGCTPERVEYDLQ